MQANELAQQVAELVGNDREAQHGSKAQNFGNIAAMWSAYLAIRREPVAPLTPLDVGNMMVLLKVARTQLGEHNIDDYRDAAGYAVCAGEIADSDGR